MKGIYEILKEFGLEIPEDKKTEFEKLLEENYRTKEEYDKTVTQRDNYKESLETATTELEKFKDAKPEEMQATIKKLQNDLKEKEKAYADRETEYLFQGELTKAIRKVDGRNEKAIMALLDLESLKASKNQAEDIKRALETVKESDSYLFGAKEPINNPVSHTGGSEGTDTTLAAMRAAAGLPPAKE